MMTPKRRTSVIYTSLLIIFSVVLAAFIRSEGDKTIIALDQAGRMFGNAKFISETADIYRFEAVGLSMYPTLKDGAIYRADKHAIPKVDDIIAFKCLVERCDYHGMVKFVRGIDENGCYDLQGREDEWVEEDGITYVSFDSSDFGSLCPREIHVNGVVKVPKE